MCVCVCVRERDIHTLHVCGSVVVCCNELDYMLNSYKPPALQIAFSNLMSIVKRKHLLSKPGQDFQTLAIDLAQCLVVRLQVLLIFCPAKNS